LVRRIGGKRGLAATEKLCSRVIFGTLLEGTVVRSLERKRLAGRANARALSH